HPLRARRGPLQRRPQVHAAAVAAAWATGEVARLDLTPEFAAVSFQQVPPSAARGVGGRGFTSGAACANRGALGRITRGWSASRFLPHCRDQRPRTLWPVSSQADARYA